MSEKVRIDISHTPKRYQQDIETENDSDVIEDTDEIDVPISVTLESAITFYEKNAEGIYKSLYERTASWLKMLLSGVIVKQPATGMNDALKMYLESRVEAKQPDNENN